MCNKPSELRIQILDMWNGGSFRPNQEIYNQQDIANELNCGKSVVSMYVNDFKAKLAEVKSRRKACRDKQQFGKCPTKGDCHGCGLKLIHPSETRSNYGLNR